jgi:hypothetical protein
VGKTLSAGFSPEAQRMSIYQVFDKCPTPANGHMIAAHVKKNATNFDANKSFFTDTTGAEIDTIAALQLLAKAKDTAANLSATKRDQHKSIVALPKEVCRITADDKYLGFAVTWGDQVGTDRYGAACKWVCLFVTKKMESGRHQWVSAYPATDTYVAGKRF